MGALNPAIFRQFEAERQAANAKQAQAQPRKKDKGFWLDQISTGTGIGGAAGGAALGASVGSIIPGAGTAVGGILGALIGGAVGSGGGEVAENAITGDDLFKNVGREAALGGVTSLPIGAALKLGRAGFKASTGVGKAAAGDLVQEAGVQTIGKRAVNRGSTFGGVDLDSQALDAVSRIQGASTTVGKKGKGLEQIGSRILASQGQVTGAQARQMGIQPVKAFGRVNQRTGLTNLDDMAEFSRSMTGGQDSILDTLTRAAVDGTTGVDIGDLRTVTTKLIDDKGKLLSEAQRKSLLKQVQNVGTGARGGSAGSLSPLAKPQEVLNSANSFRDAAASIKNSFNAKPEQKQLANIYNRLADDLETKLYSAPGVDDSMKVLSKAGSDDLFLKAQELRAAGNKPMADAYQKLGQEVFGMKNVKQLRSMKKDFVDLGRIDKATAQAEGARGFNAGDAVSNIRNQPIRGILGALGNAVTPKLGGAAAAAGRTAQGVGTKSVGQSLPGLATRQIATRAGVGALTASQTAPEVLPEDQALADGSIDQLGAEDAALEEPSIGGYTKSQIEQAMAQAVMDGESGAYKQLAQLYEMLPQQQTPDLSSSTAQLAAKQDTGLSEITRLEQAYAQAGGGQGVVGGNIANALGGINVNPAAGAYNDQLEGRARLLGRAMGEVGAGSDSDARAFVDRLPKLTDSPERAAQKIAELRALLQQSRQNTLYYGAGATSDRSS